MNYLLSNTNNVVVDCDLYQTNIKSMRIFLVFCWLCDYKKGDNDCTLVSNKYIDLIKIVLYISLVM